MDEGMSDKPFSRADEEDEHLFLGKDYGQLDGPMRKIPRTGNLFTARVQLVTQMLGSVKKEATTKRKHTFAK